MLSNYNNKVQPGRDSDRQRKRQRARERARERVRDRQREEARETVACCQKRSSSSRAAQIEKADNKSCS